MQAFLEGKWAKPTEVLNRSVKFIVADATGFASLHSIARQWLSNDTVQAAILMDDIIKQQPYSKENIQALQALNTKYLEVSNFINLNTIS